MFGIARFAKGFSVGQHDDPVVIIGGHVSVVVEAEVSRCLEFDQLGLYGKESVGEVFASADDPVMIVGFSSTRHSLFATANLIAVDFDVVDPKFGQGFVFGTGSFTYIHIGAAGHELNDFAEVEIGDCFVDTLFAVDKYIVSVVAYGEGNVMPFAGSVQHTCFHIFGVEGFVFTIYSVVRQPAVGCEKQFLGSILVLEREQGACQIVFFCLACFFIDNQGLFDPEGE